LNKFYLISAVSFAAYKNAPKHQKKGLLQMFHLQQHSYKIFDFVAYIDWFQGVKRPEMAVFDR